MLHMPRLLRKAEFDIYKTNSFTLERQQEAQVALTLNADLEHF